MAIKPLRALPGRPSLRGTIGLCVVLSACLPVAESPAQGTSRVDLLESRGVNAPTLQSDFPFPVSTVRALRFLRSGRDHFLLAAGDDRVVHWWKVNFHKGRPHDLVLLHTLRWPVARGQGQVLALDAAAFHDGTMRVAFGGNGIYASRVMIFSSDRIRAPVVLDPETLAGSHQQVLAIQFHPSNPQLLAVGYSGDPQEKDAQVIVWKTAGGKTRPMLQISTGLGGVDGLAFSGDGHQIAVCDSQTGEYRAFSLGEAGEPLVSINTDTGIHGLIWTQPGKWQVATGTHGLIEPGGIRFDEFTIINRTGRPAEIRDTRKNTLLAALSGDERYTISTADLRIRTRVGRNESGVLPLSAVRRAAHLLDIRFVSGELTFGLPGLCSTVAASADGRWSVTGRQGVRFAGHLQKPVAVVRDHQSGQETVLTVPGIDDAIRAAAITKDGRFVAVATRIRSEQRDASPVSICFLDRISGSQLLAVPPADSQSPSTGRISAVRLGTLEVEGRATGYIDIGFGGQLGNVLTSRSLTPASSSQVRLTLQDIELGTASRKLSVQVSPSQLWLRTDGESSFTLNGTGSLETEEFQLQKSPELQTPTAALRFELQGRRLIAVGYSQGAVAVWDMETEHPVRRFYGHNGAVLALDVSDDGQLLVSGGDDGVLRGWPLQDIAVSELGLTFQADTGPLKVDQVKPGWPGFFAGFKPGHEILKIVKVEPGGSELTVPPGERRAALQNPTPGRQLLVTVQAGAQQATLHTTARFEPMFELWLLSNGEWLVSTPQKLFAVSDSNPVDSSGVMRHFGWNVNLGREGVSSTRFFPLETYSSDESGNRFRIAAAITRRKPVRTARAFRENVWPSRIAIEAIRAGTRNTPVIASIDGPVDLSVDLTARTTGNERILEASLWCNGRRIKVPQVASEQGESVSVAVPGEALRTGTVNLLVASVTSEISGRILVGRDVRTIVVGEKPQNAKVRRTPRIHYIGVGVTDLDAANEFASFGIRPLKFSANDAWFFGQALLSSVDGSDWSAGYERGYFGFALNPADIAGDYDKSLASDIQEPTGQGVLTLLAELNGQVSADDFVCVLMTGHGFSIRSDGQQEQSGFFFATRDCDPELSRAVTGKDLFRHLDQFACPTLLLLDACHSGGISSNHRISPPGQLSLGPEIITSSRSRQLSYVSEKIGFQGRRRGHSLFTAAAIEALSGHRIELTETGSSAVRTVPTGRLRRDADGNGNLTVSELAVYLQRRVPMLQRAAGLLEDPEVKEQNPEILPSSTFTAESIRFSVTGQ